MNKWNNQGSVLPAIIFSILILLMITGTALGGIWNNIKMQKAVEEKIIAQYVAESAIEHGIMELHEAIKEVMEKANTYSGICETEDPCIVQFNVGDDLDLTTSGNQDSLNNHNYSFSFSHGANYALDVSFDVIISENPDIVTLSNPRFSDPQQLVFFINGATSSPKYHGIEAEVEFYNANFSSGTISYYIKGWDIQ